MQSRKKSFVALTFAVGLIAGTLVTMTATARADVACNGGGECWKTHPYGATAYPPDLRVQVYNDAWREQHEHDTQYRWMKDRDDDHGYYKNGEWHGFEKK